MAVKSSQSASRVLAVLETVSAHQPIGVSALARHLAADKSAIQRAITTLAADGWIRAAPGTPTRWELTPRILAVAHVPHSMNDLRLRARPALEALRRDTGETVFLTVPDTRRFIVIDALESHHVLRMVPAVGMIVPVRESATGRAFLPFASPERQIEFLGAPPDQAMLAEFALTRARVFSVSDGDIAPGSATLAAPILDRNGAPIGAVVTAGPRERITPARHAEIGAMVAQKARAI